MDVDYAAVSTGANGPAVTRREPRAGRHYGRFPDWKTDVSKRIFG
jgi:hypothetical protein